MIYYTKLKSIALNSYIFFAKNKKGICRIDFTKNENEFVNSLKKKYNDEVIFSPKMMLKEAKQLKKYFEGKGKGLSLKSAPSGSDFQLRVWNAISKIPYGKTISYTGLAKAVKEPKAFRAVANACGKNPVPIVIPCHRVISKDGSLGGYSGGLDMKKSLLKIEKIKL
ncbi:MAG: methylated-DNA--[protein]-cysteine S-methyltransferase [Ignavibacteria bacterium]